MWFNKIDEFTCLRSKATPHNNKNFITEKGCLNLKKFIMSFLLYLLNFDKVRFGEFTSYVQLSSLITFCLLPLSWPIKLSNSQER